MQYSHPFATLLSNKTPVVRETWQNPTFLPTPIASMQHTRTSRVSGVCYYLLFLSFYLFLFLFKSARVHQRVHTPSVSLCNPRPPPSLLKNARLLLLHPSAGVGVGLGGVGLPPNNTPQPLHLLPGPLAFQARDEAALLPVSSATGGITNAIITIHNLA